MWVIGGTGFLGSLLAFVLSFFPPSQINVGGNMVWFSVLFGGVALFVILPFVIYACRKPSWVNPSSNFVPFHWQKDAESQKLLAEAQQAYEAQQAAEGATDSNENVKS